MSKFFGMYKQFIDDSPDFPALEWVAAEQKRANEEDYDYIPDEDDFDFEYTYENGEEDDE